MDDEKKTDEDKMIEKFEAHRDIGTLMFNIGKISGINVKRTTGNDPKGDFSYPKDKEDQLIKTIAEYLPGKRKN